MKFLLLSADEKKLTGANVAAILDNTDLAGLANGNTGTINIAPPAGSALSTPRGSSNATLPSGYNPQFAIGVRIKMLAMRLITPFVFSDAAIVSCAATVGDSGSAARYMASKEMASAGANVAYDPGTGTAYILLAADNVAVAFTGTAAHNLNTATAGQVAFYLDCVDITQLPII